MKQWGPNQRRRHPCAVANVPALGARATRRKRGRLEARAVETELTEESESTGTGEKPVSQPAKYFVVVGFCFFFPHFLAMLALSVISCQLILNNYFKFKKIRETAL